MKIAIIGYSGSGKSTLAQKLGTHYSIPILHMDTIQFVENWIVRPHHQVKQDLETFLRQHSHWIIDGNYSSYLYEKRMSEATQIIFMNFSRFTCLWRVTKRYFTYHHRVRESSAKGCVEKLDWEFIKWILRDGRRKESVQRYQEICNRYSHKVTIIRNQHELDLFLKQFI